MSTIPNVSSVYRDLSSIYTSASLAGNAQSHNIYSLQPKISNEKTCFEDMYAYKQKRHNELMSRLQNSYEQHKQLVGGFQNVSYSQPQYSNLNRTTIGAENYYSRPSEQSYSSINPYSGNPRPNFDGNRTKTSNFIIPKIRYRHIQDQKSKNPDINLEFAMNEQKNERSFVQPVRSREVQQLQQQFYEDNYASNQDRRQIRGTNKDGVGVQTKSNQMKNFQEEDKRSSFSNHTNNFARSGRNGNYSQKIESYYELCRKNISIKSQDEGKLKQQKFIRGNSTKNKAMKLDQAIKMLSLQ